MDKPKKKEESDRLGATKRDVVRLGQQHKTVDKVDKPKKKKEERDRHGEKQKIIEKGKKSRKIIK